MNIKSNDEESQFFKLLLGGDYDLSEFVRFSKTYITKRLAEINERRSIVYDVIKANYWVSISDAINYLTNHNDKLKQITKGSDFITFLSDYWDIDATCASYMGELITLENKKSQCEYALSQIITYKDILST